MGVFKMSCLLIQIQNELCSYKVLKNFEFGTKNVLLGICSVTASVFKKQLSYFTNQHP